MVTLLTSVCLMGPVSMLTQTHPQVVQAASKGKLRIKEIKKYVFIQIAVKNLSITLIQAEHIPILLRNI